MYKRQGEGGEEDEETETDEEDGWYRQDDDCGRDTQKSSINLELGGDEEEGDDGEDVTVKKMAIAKPKKPEKQVAAKRPPSGGGWSTAMKLAVIRGGEQSLSDLLFRYNLTPGTGGTWVRLMFCFTSSHVFYWCMTGMYYLVCLLYTSPSPRD